MKDLYRLLILCLFTGQFTNAQQAPLMLIKGTLTHTNSYCGGAAPSDEMLREIYAEKPLPNKIIYFRPGIENNIQDSILYKAKSDDFGCFELYLPVGTYCIIDERQKDDTYVKELFNYYKNGDMYFTPIDKNCLDQWLKNPLYVLEVNDKNNAQIKINFHNPCSWDRIPCTSYTGPYPP